MIRYTRHARDQMALRRISEAEVEDVLKNYHTHTVTEKATTSTLDILAAAALKW